MEQTQEQLPKALKILFRKRGTEAVAISMQHKL